MFPFSQAPGQQDAEYQLKVIREMFDLIGFVPREGQSVAEVLGEFIHCSTGVIGQLEHDLVQAKTVVAATEIAGEICARALGENVRLRQQLIDDVAAVIKTLRVSTVDTNLYAPIVAALTEALAGQPQLDEDETPVPPDENGIKDLEADEGEVDPDWGGPNDLDRDADTLSRSR